MESKRYAVNLTAVTASPMMDKRAIVDVIMHTLNTQGVMLETILIEEVKDE
jgi:hypothetical protein